MHKSQFYAMLINQNYTPSNNTKDTPFMTSFKWSLRLKQRLVLLEIFNINCDS